MRTRNSNFPNNSNVTIPRRRNRGRAPNVVEPELRTIVEVAPMAERTMEELLRAPTEGYGEAIVLPEINADHFEIKTNLLQLVQANPFHGYERENPHAHINSFKRITSTLRFRDVPNDVIKLMMFPYSLEGNARLWYEKEPPNSILTWEDLKHTRKGKFALDSVLKKHTHSQRVGLRFQQRFDESFYEAWDRFNDLLRACPHHGFSELHQLDTFYNALNANDQDSLNSAAVELIAKVSSNSSTPGISPDVAALTTEVSELKNFDETMLIDKQKPKLQLRKSGRSLPSNTITNPKEDLKGITTRSGTAYQGPTIPTSSPKVVERRTEVTKDMIFPTNNGITKNVQPPVVLVENQNPISEPDDAPVSAPMPNQKSSIPYPSRRNDEKRRENADEQKEKFYEIFKDISFEISFMDALTLMPKFASTLKSLIGNKEKLSEMARTPLNEH
ncbi:reverse transcriptase domain-containing protein [Tanacetum coccineum]